MDPGTKLGPYEIIELLGEGGMGEVYLAEDTRLHRKVAVKVLPAEFAGDPERLARFEQEARAAAALNHPHIAAVHDVGHEEGVHFMVQEYLHGETLRTMIASGRVPLALALELGVEICEGLAAAHAAGIVHRDLKPDNIFFSADGHAKILDFGLAKLTEIAAGGKSGSASMSPTALGTVAGQIMGTAGYMAPEQAQGEEVDHRADLFAFGCVLYELTTGKGAFRGKNMIDTLNQVTNVDPAGLETIDGTLPTELQRILDKALAKDARRRYQTAGDLAVDLQSLGRLVESGKAIAIADGSPRIASRNATTKVAAAATLGLLAGLALGWWGRGAPEPPPERHVILATDSVAVGTDSLALSPNGTLVAEFGAAGIRIRATDDLSWRTLPDTEGDTSISFNATGERIYFARYPEVLSVAADGGSPIVEATFPEGTQVYALYRGLDGVIQASTWSDEITRIFRIPAGGGAEELWSGSIAGTRVIVTGELSSGRWIGWAATIDASLGLVVLQAGVPESPVLLERYRQPLHLGEGKLLAVDQRGRLSVMHLDPSNGEVIAQPAVRIEGLALSAGRAAYDATGGGTLVYVSGAPGRAGQSLMWIGRDGGLTAAAVRTGFHDIDSRLAPDGHSLALEVVRTETAPSSVWIHDLERDVSTTLTPGISSTFPVWSPDSSKIVLRLDEGIEPAGMYVVPVDRSAPPRLLLAEEEGVALLPMDWSIDGETLLYVRSPTINRVIDPANDIGTLPLGGGDPVVFLDSAASEIDPRYSPDGRWIAYLSDQSGQYEVYLRPVGGGGEIRVSADGGHDPEWNPAGGELFFLRDRQLFSVAVRAGADRPVGPQREIVELPRLSRPQFVLPGADGQSFMVSMLGADQESTAVHAVFNWRLDASR